MHIEDAVELGPRRQRIQPPHLLVRDLATEPLVRLGHLGTVLRRLEQPTLAVAADPGRVGKLTQAGQRLYGVRARRAVVAAEQPAVDARVVGIGEHCIERIQVAVDVVEDAEHVRLVSRE